MNWEMKKKGDKMKKLVLMFIAFFTISSRAELRINIDGAKSDPTPIAIADFISSNADLGQLIPQVIQGDLERSHLFRVIDQDAYIQHMDQIGTQPRFGDWQAIGAHALIHGEITEGLDGKLHVSFRIWDVFAQQQLDAKSLSTTPESWRKIAHIISDTIYERLTGEKGYFDTKIAFVS